MYGAGVNVFAVWGYVIANAYPRGEVELNARKLADTLGGDETLVAKAIEYLCADDSVSRSKDEAGARLVREGEYMYRVVNWEKYRDLMSQQTRRVYQANWKRDRDLRSSDPEQISDPEKEERERVREVDTAVDTESTQGRQRSTRVKASRMTPDWRPSDMGKLCNTLRLRPGDVEARLPAFVDHWLQATGKGALKADWEAACRNWLRRDIDDGKLERLPLPAKVLPPAKPWALEVIRAREAREAAKQAVIPSLQPMTEEVRQEARRARLLAEQEAASE